METLEKKLQSVQQFIQQTAAEKHEVVDFDKNVLYTQHTIMEILKRLKQLNESELNPAKKQAEKKPENDDETAAEELAEQPEEVIVVKATTWDEQKVNIVKELQAGYDLVKLFDHTTSGLNKLQDADFSGITWKFIYTY